MAHEQRRETIFISYAREDQAFVRDLASELAQRAAPNLSVAADWLLVAGVDYAEQLTESIRRAVALVFVLSPSSVSSKACLMELQEAIAEGKRIVPVRGNDVEADGLPEPLRVPQWVVETDVGSAAEAIMTAVRTNFELAADHAALLLAATAWANGSRALPRGKELEAMRRLIRALDENPLPLPRATELQRQYVAVAGAARRRATIISLGIGCAAVASVLFAVYAAYQQRELRRVERGFRLAMAAQAEARGEPKRLLRSGELALEGLTTWRTAEADASLRGALQLLPTSRVLLRDIDFEVLDIQVSADGKYVAVVLAGSAGGGVLHVVRPSDPQFHFERALRDGEQCAFVGQARIALLSGDGRAAIVRLDNGEVERTTVAVGPGAPQILSSADGRYFALAGHSEGATSVGVYRANDGTRLRDWSLPWALAHWAFSPFGDALAAASNEGHAGVLRLTDGAVVTRDGPADGGSEIVFADEGCVFVGQSAWRMPNSHGGCYDRQKEPALFGPRGTRALVGDASHGAKLYPAHDGFVATRPQDLIASLPAATKVLFSNDDRMLALQDLTTVRLFDTGDGRERARVIYDGRLVVYEVGPQPPIRHIALSPDGGMLYAAVLQAAGSDPDAQRYALVAYETIGWRPPFTLEETGKALAISRDGRLIAVGGEKTLIVFDTHTQNARHATLPRSKRVTALAFSGDQQTVFFGTDEPALGRWKWETEPPTVTAGVDGSTVLSIAVSAAGQVAVGTARAGTLLWDGETTSTPTPLVRTQTYERVDRVAFDASGERLIQLVRSGVEVVALKALKSALFLEHPECQHVDFSEDLRVIVTGGGQTVKVWESGRPAARLRLPHDRKFVSRVALSPNGRMIAAAAGVWAGLAGGDTRDGLLVVWRRGDPVPHRVFSHPQTVWNAQFSADSRYLASIAYDGKLRLWDVDNARQLAEIDNPHGGFEIGFASNDRYIATANSAYAWQLEDLAAAAQPRIVRP